MLGLPLLGAVVVGPLPADDVVEVAPTADLIGAGVSGRTQFASRFEQ